MGKARMTGRSSSPLRVAAELPLVFIAGLFILCAGTAAAAPSRIFTVPNANALEYGAMRADMESKNTLMKSNAEGGWNQINYGFTFGLIPYTASKSYGIEIGLDYRDFNGSIPAATGSPLFYNLKFALREGGLISDNLPGIAAGIFDFGGKAGISDANIMYLIAAKTFPGAWRMGLGLYSGNSAVLVDETGQKANSGMLFSLDWQLNKRWWVAADYMSGHNRYAAMNVGVGYSPNPGMEITASESIYNNPNIKPALSVQLIIGF